jgi:O-antigen/teichoic acid export membrane protein
MTGALRELPENFRNFLRVARLRPFDTSTDEGRSLERYRRIVLGTAASLVGRLVTTLAGLIVVPVTLGYLGKDRYGLWVAAGSLAAWVGLLDPGLSAGLLNGIAESEGRDDRGRARSLFSTALFTLAVVAALALVGFGLAIPYVPWASLFSVPPGLGRGEALWTVAASLGLAVLALPFGTVAQVYVGSQRAYLATAFATLGSLIALGALLGVVAAGGTLPVVAAALGSGGLVAGLVGLAFLLRREMPWMRPRLADVGRPSYRRLAVSAAPLYLFGVGSLLVNQTQTLVLARRASLSLVAEYDLVWRFVALGVALVTLSTGSAFPTFREAWERGDRAWMRRAFWHVLRLRLALAAVGCTALVLLGNLVLRVWLRRTDFQYSPVEWLLLSAIIGVAIWTSCFLELLTVLDRIWFQIPVVLVQGALTIGLTWFLVPSLGIRGALLGALLPSLGLASWIFPRFAWPIVAQERAG